MKNSLEELDKLSNSKKKGKMGFHDLRAFNLAMLAKNGSMHGFVAVPMLQSKVYPTFIFP